MYVVAVHNITDPQRFFPAAEAGMQDLPAGLHVQTMAPSGDGSRAVCLWEADSLDAVKALVEGNVGDSSRNEFYEVDAGKAIGLPA